MVDIYRGSWVCLRQNGLVWCFIYCSTLGISFEVFLTQQSLVYFAGFLNLWPSHMRDILLFYDISDKWVLGGYKLWKVGTKNEKIVKRTRSISWIITWIDAVIIWKKTIFQSAKTCLESRLFILISVLELWDWYLTVSMNYRNIVHQDLFASTDTF